MWRSLEWRRNEKITRVERSITVCGFVAERGLLIRAKQWEARPGTGNSDQFGCNLTRFASGLSILGQHDQHILGRQKRGR